MTLLLTILFLAALLVLVAGGLLASDPSRNPPETLANLLGRQGEFRRPALGKCAEQAEADEDDCWWRDWWTYAE